MVRFTQDVIPTMARYRNFGSVRTMGVELEAKSDVLPVLYLYANGTYQDLSDTRKFTPGTDVENPTKGKRIPNVPYLLANFGAEYHQENLFGGRGQNTRVLFDASYVHQYYYDFEVSSSQDSYIIHNGCSRRAQFRERPLDTHFQVKELGRPPCCVGVQSSVARSFGCFHSQIFIQIIH